jgi:hypothetical protein
MYVAGSLLIAGMRACADLAEGARARRDEAAQADAVAAAADLASWVDRLEIAPFADRPADVYPPAERATWQAERARLADRPYRRRCRGRGRGPRGRAHPPG